MSKNIFSVDYEIYNVNTNETIDRRSMEVRVSDKQLREIAQVMENNGGYAPELSVFQHIYNYLCEECIMDYQENYAPDDDEFWENHTVDPSENLPDELLEAAEKYVKYKEVNIIYYYEEDGEEKTGNALVQLPVATYQAMVEAAKTKLSEKNDFAHLKEACPKVFDEVLRLVTNEAVNVKTSFILKEFPYQVLEQAMTSM
ncbi:MAG: hypothetical protein J6Y97_06610 [Prevotella sp.]|nr:hypothetical protein [Prevotella sp.]